uniref:Uncharacterized protein n=1 Tax=Romanomermis culicivorax TaxID=13658 RepID=A0A915IQG6_ROMCU
MITLQINMYIRRMIVKQKSQRGEISKIEGISMLSGDRDLSGTPKRPVEDGCDVVSTTFDDLSSTFFQDFLQSHTILQAIGRTSLFHVVWSENIFWGSLDDENDKDVDFDNDSRFLVD